MMDLKQNMDKKVVEGFGDEWVRFDQDCLTENELEFIFRNYFDIFPWDKIGKNSVGFDLGCGSGRWALLVAPRVKELHCIDASEKALNVAKNKLSHVPNCLFHLASVDSMPVDDGTQDFGYSLGVLHHLPNALEGIKACAKKLKPGAPFLLYCYYAFDNKPLWYKSIWKFSDIIRSVISRLPMTMRYYICQIIALAVYFPFSRIALLLEKVGVDVVNIPLSYYRHHSLYVMRNDALDRFGTSLEKRFTRDQLHLMMEEAGLENIIFSDSEPYWCAIGFLKS